jgi:UDP-GlcNAc:undecaprenyl-phosphate GlcNAc-1-phosphate transferase
MIPLVAGFAVSVVSTWLVFRLAKRHSWVVRPRPDRWSQQTVAKFGGVPLLLAGLGCGVIVAHDRKLFAVITLTAAMGLLGLFDDLVQLRPRYKLMVQVVICGIASYLGVVYPLSPNANVNLVFSTLWLVGITNAFNIIDNMDGLSCGVAAIALIRMILLGGLGGGSSQVMLAMVGSLLGFLIFNFNPAKIFMGDTGSLGIGFFVACSSVLLTDHISGIFSILAIPVLILLLPVFDVLLVTATRKMKGRAVTAGARDHTSHRLVLLGMSERQAVILLYFFAATAGAMTYFWKADWPNLGAGIVALYLSMATLFWLYLARIELPEEWLSKRRAAELALPSFLTRVTQRAAVVFLDAVMLGLSMYFAFLFRLDGLTKQLFGLLLFTSALSIAIRIPLLSMFQVSGSEWRIRSRHAVYPVLLVAVLGGLLLLAGTYLLPSSKHVLPAVLGLDIVFSAGLLILVRLMPSMLDDLISGQKSQPSLVILPDRDSASAFEDKKAMIAIGSRNGLRSAFLFGVPISHSSEAAELIARQTFATIYLLPECPEAQRQEIVKLCKERGTEVRGLRYSVEALPGDQENSLPVRNVVGD